MFSTGSDDVSGGQVDLGISELISSAADPYLSRMMPNIRPFELEFDDLKYLYVLAWSVGWGYIVRGIADYSLDVVRNRTSLALKFHIVQPIIRWHSRRINFGCALWACGFAFHSRVLFLFSLPLADFW